MVNEPAAIGAEGADPTGPSKELSTARRVQRIEGAASACGSTQRPYGPLPPGASHHKDPGNAYHRSE